MNVTVQPGAITFVRWDTSWLFNHMVVWAPARLNRAGDSTYAVCVDTLDHVERTIEAL